MLDDSSSQPDSQAGSQTGASVAEPLVRFTNVQKSYDGEILVVKDLNLDVEQGEFLKTDWGERALLLRVLDLRIGNSTFAQSGSQAGILDVIERRGKQEMSI